MALSGLDIYKLLPKTNCRQCGFATCLAFAMQLAKKSVTLDKCPTVSAESKVILDAQAQPPIKSITLGQNEAEFEIGNETVIFRHEEKFRNPTGIGFIIEDSLTDQEILERLDKIDQLKFERVGQTLNVNLVAVKQNSNLERFLGAVKLVSANTKLALMFINRDPAALKQAAELAHQRKPLIYCTENKNLNQLAAFVKERNLTLVVMAKDLNELALLTKELNTLGVNNLILDTGIKPLAEKIWDLTQLRRQALKKFNRSLGYPTLTIVDNPDPYAEAIEAAAYIAKYSSLVLIKGVATWQILAILTLRQNIFTDPQKPLQMEAKLYPVGQVNENSPALVTTNFSLTYFTVLNEVESSKIPAYILCVDTQGMSVLTAWAAEKFNAECITKALNNHNLATTVKHNQLIIPGYVAMISGDLAEQSKFKIIVGPKEAAGIPAFLKNLNKL